MCTLYYKVLFMEEKIPVSAGQQGVEVLKDIRYLMERSSRFISLSGWSGVAAGIIALAGAGLALQTTGCWRLADCLFDKLSGAEGGQVLSRLYVIGAGTFLAALGAALFFTWKRSRQDGKPVFGRPARRLTWALVLPLTAGGIFLLKMIGLGQYELVAPGCLVFYGLALVNGSRYTLSEVRYLGYTNVGLGLINSFLPGYGLLFWALGFGVLHIIYGIVMWWKYERVQPGGNRIS
jgi:hypothetical protein